MLNKRHFCFMGVLIFAAFTATLIAQTGSSTIVGTLTDQANAVIPGAKLVVTDQATAAIRTSVSNDSGLFRILDLKPGTYSLKVEITGFKTLEIKDINLASAETRDLGRLVLQLGELTEQVTVTAQATPVQTASSERSSLIDNQQLNEVSLKGRDAFGYMRLLPGIVDMNQAREIAGPGSAGNISINGMASNTKNVTFDGVTQLDQGGANAVYVSPNIDAIGEMRVLSSAYQAEYGRTAGGGINIISKAGTRDFHGTGFWNRRHEGMNANSFFNNRQGIARPIYRYAILGYSIGGPVYIPGLFNKDKNRLFFFFSQEFARVAQPTTVSTANLPTEAERIGDFSNSRNSLGQIIPIIDPQTGKQFPGNKIPASRIDPTGQALLNFFPKPNGYVNPAPGQQYTANFKESLTPYYHRSDTILRVDALVTDKLNVYVRYGKDTRDQLVPFQTMPGVGSLNNFLPGNQTVVRASYMISPTMVNEVVVGMGHNNFGYDRAEGESSSTWYRTSSLNPPTLRPFPTGPQYQPYLPAATYAGGAVSNPGAFYPGFNGYGSPGDFNIPYKNYNDTYTVQDDLSKVIGSHSLKTGVYYEYNKKAELSRGFNYMGVFNFGSNVNNPLDAGHGYANALLGIFQTYTEGSNRLIPDPHFVEVEGYIQDSWRVGRGLTFDFGVRWYHMGKHTDNANAYSGFYPQLWNPNQASRIYRPAVVNGKIVAIDPGTGNTTYAALQNTLVPGSGNPVNGMNINGLTGKGDFFEWPFLAFTPRLGFAWDVYGNGKLAIRGSFGTFYNRQNANILMPQLGSPPVVYTPVIYYSPIKEIPNAASSAAYAPTIAATAYGKQDLEQNHQFNITIQRDIGFNTVVDFAYVGNFNRHAFQDLGINNIPEHAYADPANLFNNTALNPNLLRTGYPGMGAINHRTFSLSNLNYHGLQVAAQHRLSHGLQFGVAYGFSKALGTQAWDPYNSQRDRHYGPLAQDRTHVLSINYSYNLPGVKSGFARYIINDWVLSGITAVQSGAAVTPACSSVSPGVNNSDPSLSGLGSYASNNLAGARCQLVADPKDFTHDFYNNFNTKAFAMPPVGTYGNMGIGILRQPAWNNFDVTLGKKIRLGKDERKVLRFRIEAYNVFNHTEFSTIGTTMTMQGTNQTNTQWGQYTATLSPRQMSTTLRIEF